MKKMNNKVIWSVVIVVFAILLFSLLFWMGKSKETNKTTCAKEGQSIGSCVGCIRSCCDGLIPVSEWGKGNVPPPGAAYFCTKK